MVREHGPAPRVKYADGLSAHDVVSIAHGSTRPGGIAERFKPPDKLVHNPLHLKLIGFSLQSDFTQLDPEHLHSTFHLLQRVSLFNLMLKAVEALHQHINLLGQTGRQLRHHRPELPNLPLQRVEPIVDAVVLLSSALPDHRLAPPRASSAPGRCRMSATLAMI